MDRWTLTIADAGGHEAPAICRLRRLLKVMLRAFGLRVVDIRQEADKPDPEPVEIF